MQGFSRQIMFVVLIVCFVCMAGLVYIGLHRKRGLELKTFFQELKIQKPILLEKLPIIRVEKIAAYRKDRDPFGYEKSSDVKVKQSAAHGLRGFLLSELKLVGIVLQGNKFWAIIKSPDGRIYKATTGARIGQSGGYITKITNWRVDVLGKKAVTKDDWVEHTTSLYLAGAEKNE